MSTTLIPEPDDAQISVVPRRSVWRHLRRDPQAVATAIILIVLFLAGLLSPLISPHDPNAASLDAINLPTGTPGYLLGGDESGRDILSRLLYSFQTATVSALIGASVALAIGVIAGLVGGYFGTAVRSSTEWLFNLIMTFPGLITLIVLLPLTHGDYRWTMLVLGVLMSPGTYRIVRNLVLGVKKELYIDAAKVSGLGDVRILARHVLFAVRGPIIVNTAFLMGSAIAAQSGLAFLGVGAKDVPSFGLMIYSGFNNIYASPLQFVWPCISLGIFTGCLVLFGNSLRDAFSGPRIKRQKPAQGLRLVTSAIPTSVVTATVERDDEPMLAIEDLGISFPGTTGAREVVKGVSLTVDQGEVVGLVGESGSGKTQTAFAVLGVLAPEARVTRGSVRLEGRELVGLSESALRSLRGRVVSYIPQEPMSNLDPSFTVGSQLTERVRHTLRVSRRAARQTVLDLLARVEIPDPPRVFRSYPHQISGGMAQRVLIAGAVACRPRLLIADEPTTALDVTVQAEILDLLRDLQKEFGMAILLVTHNFGVVADICDRIAVMRGGEIVETGVTREVFRAPRHAYTRGLLDAILDEGAPAGGDASTVGAGR
ncbi:dipeptide/oligopeptide/nickel ABC transporter permease/ATP-binding protein [Pseudolysinimonas kribbensis]|uniref:Dipeptide/oligopeptide/nickel ABC transporter ATP-binding protein n=1 Tax=Pseudolysinimonas kribbensis TaxID=433641 RepID=A0ABQ6K2H4_9MICO|nr:dipeptide/oligopeptide/nickel ABC transporter permease/ATP-binding protein [Pseudolysinimonas kribbensis]GMA94827.1 dipeptide/oligopeptide/nickel ABC transporter ATP-binding protein [Pseudolysinimonas kribbensis]